STGSRRKRRCGSGSAEPAAIAQLPEQTMKATRSMLALAAAIALLGLAPAAIPTAAAQAVVAGQSAAEAGRLAWYGNKFAGRRTASGERFDPNALTMAHKTLPFGTRVKVTNLDNERSVVVRVNDR